MHTATIMVHGAGGGGWEYARWQPVFTAAGAQVIANDLLPTAGDLAAYASSRAEVIEQIKFWYNGYSWDGIHRVYVPFSTLVFFPSKPLPTIGLPQLPLRF